MTRVVVSPQGSGKSALSRALCAKAREHLDAHVEIVDCKKLQGNLTGGEPATMQEKGSRFTGSETLLLSALLICRQAGGNSEANTAGGFGAGRVEAARRGPPR